METLIVQIGGRTGQLRELECDSVASAGIGRDFSNRIVLSDPYVAPNQASFRYEEGQWYLTNHDDTNPVLVNDEILSTAEAQLKSGDRLTIGRTEIRVFSPNHEVAPTRKLILSSWLHHDSIGLMVPLGAWIICNLLDFGVDFLLDTTQEVKAQNMVTNALVLNLMLLFWAGLWAFVGKLARHQYHFRQQFFITTLWLIAIIVLMPFLRYIDFASNGAALSTSFMMLVMLMLVAWLVKFNLYLATFGRHATAIGFVISLTIVGGISSANVLLEDDFNPYVKTNAELFPGLVLFGNGETVDDYFRKVEAQIKTEAAE